MLKTREAARVSLPASLDEGSVRGFGTALDQALENRSELVLIDCAQLEHIVSSHINLLWQAHEKCLGHSTKLRLQNVSNGLMQVLKALDLYEFFPDASRTQPLDLRALRPAEDLTERWQRYSDRFAAHDDAVNGALQRFVGYLNGMSLPEILAFELRTVFYEVATNIRIHAALDSGEEITFSAFTDGDRIKLEFSDHGVPFDLTAKVRSFDLRAAARRGQRRGFGIAMISRLTDRLSYHRDNDSTNVLTVEKVWSR